MAQEPLEIGNAAQPALNTEHQVVLGEQGPYLIKSVYADFAAGTGVASRTFQMTFTLPASLGGAVFYKCGNTTAVTGSDGGAVVAIPAPDQSTYGTDPFARYLSLPLGGLHVPSGTVIDTITENLDATDRYDTMSVMGYKRVLDVV